MENQTKQMAVNMPESTSYDKIREQNQQESFLKNDYFIDRMAYDKETLKIKTFITGKHFFLHPNPEKLDAMNIRLDLMVSIYKNSSYYCEITVEKFIIRHGNKVIYLDNFDNQSEEDKQYQRTYTLEASNFIQLTYALSNYYANIFFTTLGVENPEEYPVITLDYFTEEISEAHYKFDEKDSDEIQQRKMKIEKMLRDTYEQRFKIWALKGVEVQKKKAT